MTSEEQSHLTLPHDLTPLHYACQHGRVDVAKLLLNNYKYSIERRDVNGCTPLHTAAQYGQLEVFKHLLQILFTNGGTHLQLRVDSKLCHTLMSVYQQTLSERHRDLSGNTPLHRASKYGSLDIVQLLIQEIGCDPQEKNKSGMSCLDLAAQYGHLPLVKYLTTQHCDLLGMSSTTSLLLATESGHLDVVKFFIEELQCDPNGKDTQEITLLHHASKHGHLSTVKYLVDIQKCDPLCPDEKLNTPLHVASSLGHTEVVKFLAFDQHHVKNADNNTPLHLAALEGRLEVVTFLIENLKCDPNSRGESKFIPLHLASKNGHHDTVKYLVESQQCDPLCPDENGNTSLHVAASYGQLEVVKYFTIDQNCDPLTQNIDNNTPLHLCVHEGRLDVVKFLIEELNCDPNIRGDVHSTPLHFASQGGHLNTIKYLVEMQKCDPLCPDKKFSTPLHVAASFGNLEVVKYFTIGRHCVPLVKNVYNNTPLHLAAQKGRLDVVKFLIEVLKCDPNCRGELKRTPLHFASQGGHLNVIKYFSETLTNSYLLCPDESANTPLHLAASIGHLEVVKYFTINQRCDPLVKNALNNAPLHLAALRGRPDVVKFFVEDLKCDPNTRGDLKRIPLHLASQGGHLNIIKYLVETQKCDPLCPNENLNTPLHVAVSFGHLEIVKYFTIDQSCDPLVKNAYKNMPLHLAATEGRLDIVKFLIETLKCDPELGGKFKAMPLHLACENGQLYTVKYLVEKQKCDPLSRDEYANTPLHVAATSGHLEVVKYFTIDRNCDPLAKNTINNAPLHVAALDGRLDVVKFLIECLKCDPNSRGDYERIPLHFASQGGHLNTIKYLVKTLNSDPLCPDVKHNTPLHVAASLGHLEVVRYFTIDQHCDPQMRNADNNTPLHHAALEGRLDVVKFLIEELNCDPNSRGEFKGIPLHFACQGGQFYTIKYLVEMQRCDPLCQDRNADTPLHVAASTGDLEVVKFFTIDRRCDPQVKNADNSTPLHLAALKGKLNVVKFFIEELKCDPNSKGRWQRDLLHFASSSSHLNIIKYLVETQNCDMMSPDEKALTPLHVAAASNNIEAVAYYSTHYKIDPLVQDISNNTPLHLAALHGNIDIVKFFIEVLNCDPNCEGHCRMTPLHLAIDNGHNNVSKFLVDNKRCNVWCPNSHGVTPFLLAVQKGNLEVIKQMMHTHRIDPYTQQNKNILLSAAIDSGIVEYFANYVDPLHQAAINGDMDTIKHYIERVHWCPLMKDRHGYNLLHTAARYGQIKVVKYLTGVNPENSKFLKYLKESQKDNYHEAAEPADNTGNNNFQVIRDLTNHYCDPLVKNANGNTPLHLAAVGGRLDVVKFLIEDLKCDPNSRGKFKRTPLHYACCGGDLNTIKYLVETQNCDILCPDENACTPLHMAAASDKLEAVKYYTTEHKIDPLVQDIFNTTPLHLAAQLGNMDVVKFFIDVLDCNPNCEDQSNTKPLHLAIKNSHHDVTKFLVNHKNCNVLSPDYDGVTPFLLAIKKGGYHEIVKQMMHTHRIDPYTQPDKKALLSAAKDSGMLEYFTNYVDPLHQAAINGDMDTVRYYIESVEWCPEVQDRHGNNLLQTAQKHGQQEVLKYLTGLPDLNLNTESSKRCKDEVKNDVNISLFETINHSEEFNSSTTNPPSKKNNTPLHLAALEGKLDTVKVLIEELKFDPNTRGELDRIPLHFASQGGHHNIIKYLVETHKCNPLCPDSNADTPLHVAASCCHTEVVRYFTTCQHCDPLVKNITRVTPFHLAALNGSFDIVKFFVDTLNCNPNCQCDSRKTPLHLAIENGHSNISKYLIDNRHCNVLSSDSDDVTPFLLAVRKGNRELVKQMMDIHRIDPYAQPDKKALLSAARDSGMWEHFTNYVDPLHQAAINGDMGTVRHYIERVKWSPLKKDVHGNNLLHTAAVHGRLEVVKYLTGSNLEHSQNDDKPCPVTVDYHTKNKDGLTAQQLAANKGYVHIESYLCQATYCTVQPIVRHLALPPSINILVMGNSGSGKSTLVKSLSLDNRTFGRFIQVKGVKPLTAGIIPTTISSQDFGKVSIYDFAGHEEYYASHEMILHQTTQPLVLIAVNISLSMADIEKQLCYWLSILSNAKNDHAMHVLVIGSHADKTSNMCIQEVERKIKSLYGNEESVVYYGLVHCDCRYSVSNGMSHLRLKISEACTSIRVSLSSSDTDSSNRMCTSLMHYIENSLMDKNIAIITVNQLLQRIKSMKSPSPNMERLTDQELLVQTCKSLSANGHLIFLSNDTDVGKSLLLTDEKIILSKVHACLGRIEQNINSLGILKEQHLKEILASSLTGTMDPSLAVKYLLIAQFCTKVTPDQLTSVPRGINEKATYFFFPNMVLVERPAQLWTSAEEDKYTHLYTWCLKCSNPRHFFTPRYLHTLFIQLIQCNTLGNTKYTIWKNGILLVHGNGTRCVIEVTHQVTQLSLVMQCLKSRGHETQLAKQKSLLIFFMKSLKSKVCPKLELTEFLLLSNRTSVTTVTIPILDVARSVIAGLPSVPYYESGDRTLPKHATISELLCFESFHCISSPQILKDIFSNRHSCYPVSQDTMASLSRELVERLHLESEDITYRQLYTKLAKHSIFTDEDIYALAGMEVSTIEPVYEPPDIEQVSKLTNPLELADLYKVNVQLVCIAKWKEFGLALGLSRATLEKIRANFQSVEQCLTEVLAALLKGQDRPHNSPLNWKEVIDTLNSPSINMSNCAKTLVQNLMRDKDKDNGVPVSPVDDSVLDSHSLMEVKMSLFSLKHKWFHLGLSLGLSYGTLKIIEQSPNEDRLTEVLVKWLDQADMTLTRGPPGWRSLAAVLDCPLVQEHDVARDIKRDHPEL